jgi:hypothetical protein
VLTQPSDPSQICTVSDDRGILDGEDVTSIEVSCVDCVNDSDCTSGYCAENRCLEPTCDDGVQNGDETGVDCGGTECQSCGAIVVVAGGPSQTVTASWSAATEWISAGTPTPVLSAPAVAFSGDEAVAVVRSTADTLRSMSWSDGDWTAPEDVGVGVRSEVAPALASGGGGVHLVYLDKESIAFRASEWTGTWSPTAEIGPESLVDGSLAGTSDGALFAFIDGEDERLYTRQLSQGSWKSSELRADDAASGIPPSIAGFAAGASALLVYPDEDGLIHYMVWTGGVWSASAVIEGTETVYPIALAANDDGSAAVAWVDLDDDLYYSVFDGADWSVPELLALDVTGLPALAPGLEPQRFEIVYIEEDLDVGEDDEIIVTSNVTHQQLRLGEEPSEAARIVVSTEDLDSVGIATKR